MTSSRALWIAYVDGVVFAQEDFFDFGAFFEDTEGAFSLTLTDFTKVSVF